MDRAIQTFIGCDNSYEESKIVIFGAGFDGTTSYRPGARFASSVMRNESYSIETYSPTLNKDLLDINIFDAGDLSLPFGNTVKVLEIIENFTDKLIKDYKCPIMIGGEHLVTLGAIRSFYKKYKNLNIVHFDAHTDLRNDYLGEKLSHATVIRRCHDLLGDFKIFQFGIRSGEREEFEFSEKHLYLNKFDFNGVENLVEKIKDDPVYFTIDLDVLDPSCFCGTGTPEAGGVTYVMLLNAMHKVTQLNIVGVDITELAPCYDLSGASTSLACKFLRELILSLTS